MTGTAPRARGRRTGSALGQADVRNSPAGAGTTPRTRRRSARRPEQPRGRGDDRVSSPEEWSDEGTAPRARGRRPQPWSPLRRLGNSPAGAGTTQRMCCARPRTREQPRGRGDDALRFADHWVVPGTAPRARGRPSTAPSRRRAAGNSPAGAGTTRGPCSRPRRAPEQPRGRGDDARRACLPSPVPGTAPRARGRRVSAVNGEPGARNSPAGAGTTREQLRA